MKNRRSIFILLLAILLMVASLTACGKKAEPLFQKITGTPNDTVVMTINGTDISAEMYYYWLSIVCEDTSAYFTDGIEWDQVLYDDVTTSKYVQNTVVDTLVQYQIVNDLDKEYNLQNKEEVDAYLDQVIAENVEQFGGEDSFNDSLDNAGVSRDNLLFLYKTQYLYTNLQNKLYAAGGPLEITDAEIQAYIDEHYSTGYYSAKHILISTVDDSNNALPDDQIAEKKALAQEILSKLRASDDPQTLFDSLRKEYSEDPGQPDEGYSFGEGEMVDAFYQGTAALKENEISNLVESSYGYHIIMRLPTVIPTADAVRESYALEKFSALFQERVSSADIVYKDDVKLMDPKEFYTAYLAA